jgi:alpha-1,3-rhamnosyl/mannosyltransferase
MRVLLNSWFGYVLKTGVGFYVDQLARHLRALQPAQEILSFHPPFNRTVTWLLEGRRGMRAGNSRRPDLARGFAASRSLRTVWNTARDGYFRWVCRWHQPDLYHEPNYIPLPFDGPVVTTIHDLSVLLYPEWHPIDRVKYFEHHFYAKLPQTTCFITDSRFTRDEMQRHLNVDATRIHVVPLAARPNFRPMAESEYGPRVAQLGLPPRYLLFVGTIEPRKNLLGLLRAYDVLPDHIRSQYPLVVVGRWGWRSQGVGRELARNASAVHLAGYVAEEDLPAVFNGATALVYPSLYEGFGLPPLEMMSCGRPVIVSDRSSLPEVVGQAGLYVEPDDPVSIARAIRALVENPDLAADLAERGLRQSRQFCWDRTALATTEVYHQALYGPPEIIRRAA